MEYDKNGCEYERLIKKMGGYKLLLPIMPFHVVTTKTWIQNSKKTIEKTKNKNKNKNKK